MLNAIPDNIRDFLRPTTAWYAAIAAIVLTLIGVMAIHTAEPAYGGKQLQWVPIALLVMVAAMIPHPRMISYLAYALSALMVVLLVLLILPGMPSSFVPRVNGAKSWFDLKFMRFQPSEVAKIVFVLALGRYLRFRDSYRTLKGLAVTFAFILVPVALILKQPDMGTAMVFGPTLLFVLVAVGAKIKHLLSLIGAAVLVVAINIAMIYAFPVDGHPILATHQVKRVKSMVELARGEADVLGDAYQQNVAMNMIGAGGLSGYGAQRSQVIVDQANIDAVLPICVKHDKAVLAKRPIANACWRRPEAQRGIYRDYADTYRKRFIEMGLDADMGLTEAQWPEMALRFTLAMPGVHCAIVGTTRPSSLDANLDAVAKGPLDAPAVGKIRDAFTRAQGDAAWPGQT